MRKFARLFAVIGAVVKEKVKNGRDEEQISVSDSDDSHGVVIVLGVASSARGCLLDGQIQGNLGGESKGGIIAEVKGTPVSQYPYVWSLSLTDEVV